MNDRLKYLFEIFQKKEEFEWVTYDEMLKEDGIYFGTCHWYAPIDELKKKYFVKENSISFPTYEIRNGKCISFYANEFPTEEQQRNATKIYENVRFTYLLRNELSVELTAEQKLDEIRKFALDEWNEYFENAVNDHNAFYEGVVRANGKILDLLDDLDGVER